MLQKVKENILDLFFPPKCITCGKTGTFLCSDCLDEIIFTTSQVCPRCNKISGKGKFCARCRGYVDLSGVVAAGYFKDPYLKELIHVYKYDGVFGLSGVLSDFMVKILKEEEIKFDAITFVPCTKKRESTRGYNQAEILAKDLARKTGKPTGQLLRKTKGTKTQVGLKRKDREKNLKNAFKLLGDSKQIKGKRILLVDDVITTGTTLNECAKVLRSAGAKEIWGAVIARE